MSDNRNPYHILDGLWGGWGPSYWNVLKDVHPTNVWQWGTNVDKTEREGDFDVTYCCDSWKRVWDNENEIWREITVEELERLPKFKPYKRCFRWNWNNTNIFPVICELTPDLSISDIVGVQPMSNTASNVFLSRL